MFFLFLFLFFQAEDGIRDLVRSRGLGYVYKRQVYGQQGTLPTSGWKKEPDTGIGEVTDPTNATIKFLVSSDNQLWLAFDIPDSSINGWGWPSWDGILMSVKDKADLDPLSTVAKAAEYFYTFWTAGLPSELPVVGSYPRFIGKYGNFTDTTRTPEQRDAWNAVTVINGTSNDAGIDAVSYTHLRAHETVLDLVCRLLLEKKKK